MKNCSFLAKTEEQDVVDSVVALTGKALCDTSIDELDQNISTWMREYLAGNARKLEDHIHISDTHLNLMIVQSVLKRTKR